MTPVTLDNPMTALHGSRLFGGALPAAAQRVDFRDLLKVQDTATDRAATNRGDRARQAAQQLVSVALIQPVMAQMDNDPFKTDLFHGGQGEKIFNGQLRSIFADRMVKQSNFPLVDAVYRQVLKKGNPSGPEGLGVIGEGLGVISERLGVISERLGVISEGLGVIGEGIKA